MSPTLLPHLYLIVLGSNNVRQTTYPSHFRSPHPADNGKRQKVNVEKENWQEHILMLQDISKILSSSALLAS